MKLACIQGLLLLIVCALVTGEPSHDRAFWRSIASHHYAVPSHESPDALAVELSNLLASPDPELRDDLAYSILTNWIDHANLLTKPTLIALTDAWRANLKDGLGEVDTNSVLKRSFSALCLSSMAAREAKAPFMGARRYHQLVAEAISYLKTERDLRGYDPTLHWIHATAHTADLLAALATSPQLTRLETTSILSAIDERLATASEVYTQGEQDRLAATTVSVIHHPKFDVEVFEPWLASIQKKDANVGTQATAKEWARYQNHTYFLQALLVRLALEPDSSRKHEFEHKVLRILKDRLD